MSIFSKKNNKVTDNGMPACSVQTAGESCHPFASISSYTPLSQYNNRIYRSIREGVPIIDSAINKIVRLMGGFEISCGDDNTDKAMKSFFSKINVGGNQQGIYAFVDNFMSQLLTYGSAIGEMVTDENGGLYALYNGDLDSVSVKRADNGIDLVFCSGGLSGGEPFKHQQRILFSVLNPEGDSIYGTSLLRGLPFVADILLKIYNTIGTNWQRLGNLRYAVTYKPNGDMSDARLAKERAQEIGRAWQEAMSCTDATYGQMMCGPAQMTEAQCCVAAWCRLFRCGSRPVDGRDVAFAMSAFSIPKIDSALYAIDSSSELCDCDDSAYKVLKACVGLAPARATAQELAAGSMLRKCAELLKTDVVAKG